MRRQEITDGWGAPSEHIERADTPRATTKDTAQRMLDSDEADSMPQDDLLECIARYQDDRGDIPLRNRIIMSNIRLVRNMARRQLGRCPALDIDDLTDEGVFGLMNAIETFDPEKGEFHPYAARLIGQAVKQAIVSGGSVIRRPMWQYDLYGKALRFQSAFLREHGMSPTTEEIAEGIKVPTEKVQDCLAAKAHSAVISENVSVGPWDHNAFTIEACDFSLAPPERALAKDKALTEDARYARYRETLASLKVSDRDKEVFERRLCLNGYPRHKNLGEIGNLFAISPSRVQQIASRVARKLGFALKDWEDRD